MPKPYTWPDWKDVCNETFLPLIHCTDRIVILWGGRGSGKSDFIARLLIFRCLTEEHFRFLLIRNTYSSIKDSSFATIRDIVHEMGLDEFFTFTLNPLEIKCFNGNSFICRGCDDTNRIKSVKDPTGAFYEEDIITESDFITISTSIRTSKAAFLTEWFATNPEVTDGPFESNWFYVRFFSHRPGELSFRDTRKIEVRPGKFIEQSVTVHHSTYKDNRWLTDDYAFSMEELRFKNPQKYQQYVLGLWGNKDTSGRMYPGFSTAKNVSSTVKYNPELPLIFSWDYNSMPGCTALIIQKDGKKLSVIDEVQLSYPNNNTRAVCNEIIKRYKGHTAGSIITGDCNGRASDTRSERGTNDVVISMQTLAQFRPSDKVPKINESVKTRCDFINELFETGYKGAELVVSNKCQKLIADLTMGQQDFDGTKKKTKVKDEATGITYERFHHCSDALDYAVMGVLSDEYYIYKRGGRSGFNITVGKTHVKNDIYGDTTPVTGGSRWRY
jgi:phage terminase large subunit